MGFSRYPSYSRRMSPSKCPKPLPRLGSEPVALRAVQRTLGKDWVKAFLPCFAAFMG